MATLGLALPLMFAAVVFSYALCLLPAVYYWSRGGAARARGLALSIFAFVIFAYAPGTIGRQQAEEYAAAQQQGDHAPTGPVSASSLEIRRAKDSYDDAFQGSEACGPECRAAAVYNGLKWIRVIMEGRERRDIVETTTFYSVEHGEKCAALEAAKPDAVCVVIAADSREQADLTVDLRPIEIRNGVAPVNSLMVVRGVKRAIARQAGGSAELLRQTDIRFEVAMRPTVLAPNFSGINSKGIAIQRHEWRVNKLTLRDTLTSLGFRLTPRDGEAAIDDKPKNWRDGVNEPLTREMLAVLDLPQTQAFNEQQGAIVSSWVMHARQIRDWSPQIDRGSTAHSARRASANPDLLRPDLRT